MPMGLIHPADAGHARERVCDILAAHASLVARDYGIPAVVGTGNATSILHTGQIVSVDGNAGTITPVLAAERAHDQP